MIIGLLGLAGSGKGTVADVLVGKGFKKESFADPVKDAVATIFSWERPMLEGDTKESREFREQVDPYWTDKFGYNVTPRLMLQYMGTEAGRNVFHTDVWVHSLLRRAQGNKNTVVADVRFPNEIEAIKKAGGYLCQIKRGAKPVWWGDAYVANNPHEFNVALYEVAKNKLKEYGIHQSEWAWVGNNLIDHTIRNDGTLEELQIEAQNMLHFFQQSDIMLD